MVLTRLCGPFGGEIGGIFLGTLLEIPDELCQFRAASWWKFSFEDEIEEKLGHTASSLEQNGEKLKPLVAKQISLCFCIGGGTNLGF